MRRREAAHCGFVRQSEHWHRGCEMRADEGTRYRLVWERPTAEPLPPLSKLTLITPQVDADFIGDMILGEYDQDTLVVFGGGDS